MSQATNANSIIRTFVAGGVIGPGHVVTVSGATVIQSAGANVGNGIYAGESACAAGDHVEVCLAGPCRAWCDAGVAIALFANLASDASGHCVVETVTLKKLVGQALEPLASGIGFVEINVNINPNL